MAKRLTKEDWLTAGLAALAENGPRALAAEPMARRIGTTKGSFYWHFKDVADFQQVLLDRWSRIAGIGFIETLEAIPDPVRRLRTLALAAAETVAEDHGGPRLEPAIRAWALGDARAATTVAAVDVLRLSYFSDQLTARGIANPEFARLIHAAHIGLSDLGARHAKTENLNAACLGTLIDLILIFDEN